MFCYDKEVGWKECGVGMFKINVFISCVEFDDDGNFIVGSFDVLGLDDGDEEGVDGGNKVVCLLMC